MATPRNISRREFIKLSGMSSAALALMFIGLSRFEGQQAKAQDTTASTPVTEVPVIWIQAGTCTGCSVSVLNSLSPRIQSVLVDEVVPGYHVSLRYHATVMAAAGDIAIEALRDTAKNKGGYLLVTEGAFSTKDNGIYCEFGEENGQGITALKWMTELAKDAIAVIALGTCAYGGIPAASPNPTGCKPVAQILSDHGVTTPVIYVPGCPPHPDWFVGTVATILIGGLASVKLDDQGRPLAFYGTLIHDNCPRRGHFDAGRFAQKLSDPYCLYKLGCKGPVTYADCPIRLWNSGTEWCVGANAPCIGCCSPDFPDLVSPFKKQEQIYAPAQPEWIPPMEQEGKGFNPGAAAAIGVAAGAVAVGGVVMASKLVGKDKEDEKK
jgi:hydrogenase small subunit